MLLLPPEGSVSGESVERISFCDYTDEQRILHFPHRPVGAVIGLE